jgi:hypothetical protein
MKKLLLLLPATLIAAFLVGCADEPYEGRVADDHPAYSGGPGYAYDDQDYPPDYYAGPGPGYYAGPGYYGPDSYGPAVDFYFEGDHPYSRDYGPLVFRDNHYYYSRGGNYVVYDRHVPSHGFAYDRDHYSHSTYRRGVQQQTRGPQGTVGGQVGGRYPYQYGRGQTYGQTYQRSNVRSGPPAQYNQRQDPRGKNKKEDNR